jgi:hypothetical protein
MKFQRKDVAPDAWRCACGHTQFIRLGLRKGAPRARCKLCGETHLVSNLQLKTERCVGGLDGATMPKAEKFKGEIVRPYQPGIAAPISGYDTYLRSIMNLAMLVRR